NPAAPVHPVRLEAQVSCDVTIPSGQRNQSEKVLLPTTVGEQISPLERGTEQTSIPYGNSSVASSSHVFIFFVTGSGWKCASAVDAKVPNGFKPRGTKEVRACCPFPYSR